MDDSLITTLAEPSLAALKRELAVHPRRSGYYLIDLVDIRALNAAVPDSEARLERLFQYFDDQQWLPADQRPHDQHWSDYEAAEQDAAREVVAALVGGPEIGHTDVTVAETQALLYWQDFLFHFSEPRQFYTRLALGSSSFVFQRGAVVVDARRAGVLWVVEND